MTSGFKACISLYPLYSRPHPPKKPPTPIFLVVELSHVASKTDHEGRAPVPRLNLSLWLPPPSRVWREGERKGKQEEDGGGAGGKREAGGSELPREREGRADGARHAPSLGRFLSHKRRQRAHQSCPAPAPAAATARPRARRRLERPGARRPRRRRAPRRPPPAPRLRRRHRLSRGSRGPVPFTSGEGREEGDEGPAGSSGPVEHLGVTGLNQPPLPFFAKRQNKTAIGGRRSRPPAPSLHLAGRHRGQLGCPVSCEPRT